MGPLTGELDLIGPYMDGWCLVSDVGRNCIGLSGVLVACVSSLLLVGKKGISFSAAIFLCISLNIVDVLVTLKFVGKGLFRGESAVNFCFFIASNICWFCCHKIFSEPKWVIQNGQCGQTNKESSQVLVSY